jgi:hypothetical protein
VQAVTRVKLEQASKVVMWTPTRPDNGEGCTDREETGAGARNSPTNEHLNPVHRGIEHGMQRKVVWVSEGGSGLAGGRDPERCQKGRRPVWASERAI